MVARILAGLNSLLLAGAVACSSSAPSHNSEPPIEIQGTQVVSPRGSPDAAPTPAAPAVRKPSELQTYPFDLTSRKVPMTGKVVCPPVGLVNYSGDVVAFHKPARINEHFAQHLRRFEEIVRDTALEIYGRAPSRITRMGSFYCRRIRAWPYLISEHGLGNAVDVGGFEFSRVAGEAAGVPAQWRRAFEVTMSKHWRAGTERDADHQKFLHLLAKRVIDEENLFRVILGPADPKHKDHFHFDMAPFRIVNVFE
jgi:hypothetical protein